jgi:DNA-binding CsgD family transcriptional regulator
MKKTKIIPSDYKTKAEAVLAMLNEGMTSAEIRKRMDVSNSYIHHLRGKLMRLKAREEKQKAQLGLGAKVEAKAEAKAEAKVEANADEVDKVLDARANQYGSFMQSADVTIKIKSIIHNAVARNDLHLYPDQLLALDMIAVKISRILTGNPNHRDSWLDIAGYAKLVADRLEGKVR